MASVPGEEPQLYFEEYGSGDPVLLIHGFGASSYSWRYLGPELAKRHRVILVDLKGFGKSPKPLDEHYSIHDQVRLVSNLIREHDLTGVTLVGHSYGGGVALLLAMHLSGDARYAPRRLILIDNVAFRQRLPFFVRLLQSPAGALVVAVLPNRLLVRNILELAYFDDGKIPAESVTAYAQALESRGGRHALVRTAECIMPPDIDALPARYGDIKVRTLILWGREDEIVPLAIGERLHRALGNSRLVVVDRCGHIPHEECPEVAAQAVLKFLDETLADAAPAAS